MSWALFKHNMKNSRFVWLLITLTFIFYIVVIMTMYDPKNSEALSKMFELFPKDLMKAFGFTNIGTTLISFLATFYGSLEFLFPLIISIIINHRLICSYVDKRSMAYLLSTPNSRLKIILTQAAFSIISITALFVASTIIIILSAEILHPGQLAIGKFILLNLYSLITYYAIGGIGFFASVIANDSKTSLSIGVGVPVGFFIIRMLANILTNTPWIKYFTLYSLFDMDKFVESSSFIYIAMIILLIIGAFLYYLAIRIFTKKDLYI